MKVSKRKSTGRSLSSAASRLPRLEFSYIQTEAPKLDKKVQEKGEFLVLLSVVSDSFVLGVLTALFSHLPTLGPSLEYLATGRTPRLDLVGDNRWSFYVFFLFGLKLQSLGFGSPVTLVSGPVHFRDKPLQAQVNPFHEGFHSLRYNDPP